MSDDQGGELLREVRRVAAAAAEVIMQVRGRAALGGSIAQRSKPDDSPVTEADMAAHQLISAELRRLTPAIPVLSEEAADVDFEARSAWPRFWLVDPLDGTKEFIAGRDEFTVNIALIEGHQPLLGVVHVPPTGACYSGVVGAGAWRSEGPGASAQAIAVATRSASRVRVAGSRSHRGDSLDGLLQRLGPHELCAVGSSLKFCLVAEGNADIYPRLGPTSEWDTAAGHAVLAAAGGQVRRMDGSSLVYNTQREWLNPHFVAFGPSDRDWLSIVKEAGVKEKRGSNGFGHAGGQA
jgi:3'(2'), 5'-bisphosphate nucleotidase